MAKRVGGNSGNPGGASKGGGRRSQAIKSARRITRMASSASGTTFGEGRGMVNKISGGGDSSAFIKSATKAIRRESGAAAAKKFRAAARTLDKATRTGSGGKTSAAARRKAANKAARKVK